MAARSCDLHFPNDAPAACVPCPKLMSARLAGLRAPKHNSSEQIASSSTRDAAYINVGLAGCPRRDERTNGEPRDDRNGERVPCDHPILGLRFLPDSSRPARREEDVDMRRAGVVARACARRAGRASHGSVFRCQSEGPRFRAAVQGLLARERERGWDRAAVARAWLGPADSRAG